MMPASRIIRALTEPGVTDFSGVLAGLILVTAPMLMMTSGFNVDLD